MQRSGTAALICSIPRIITCLSSFSSLEPGDVIATGTPAGVGARRLPPVWRKPGDVIEVDLDAIGVLRNQVVSGEGT